MQTAALHHLTELLASQIFVPLEHPLLQSDWVLSSPNWLKGLLTGSYLVYHQLDKCGKPAVEWVNFSFKASLSSVSLFILLSFPYLTTSFYICVIARMLLVPAVEVARVN